MVTILWIIAFLQLLGGAAGQRYTVWDAPTISNSHSVQFFYLEAPFPYNTPSNIINVAGSNYNRYGIGHAGLGIWDTNTDDKYSIELVSSSYTGSLLPTISGTSMTWNNTGKVVVTYPLDESNWLTARLIATTSGSAYSQLITYLQDNMDQFATFQPVTTLYVNASLFNPDAAEVTNTDFNEIGSIVLEASDSFAFVDNLINQLNSYGTDLGSFLPIYATSYNYFSLTNTAPSVVSWTGDVANAEVLAWYTELTTCYTNVFDATAQNGQGALYFLSAVKNCYVQPYAFLFRSANSVYNITLANYTTYYRSPLQAQYGYNLPPSNDGNAETLGVADYVIIALICAGILSCCGVVVHRMLTKPQRRRVSFEGERLAERTVHNMAATQEDHTYFHGKQYGGTFLGRLSGSFAGSGTSGGSSSSHGKVYGNEGGVGNPLSPVV